MIKILVEEMKGFRVEVREGDVELKRKVDESKREVISSTREMC